MPEKLKLLIRSGNPLISIETADEDRAEGVIAYIANELSVPLRDWSMTDGLRPIDKSGVVGSPLVKGGKVAPALKHILECSESAIYLFRDLGPHCKDAYVYRMLRDLLTVCARMRSTIILIDALPLPDEIRRFTVRYELGWPTADELEQAVRTTYRKISNESLREITASITRREMDQLVQTLRGLTITEAERVIASAIYDDYTLSADDLPGIVEAKRTLLGSAGCLETIAADVSPEDIGGLTNLKSWLKLRRNGFSRQAREYGLEPPRGMLMLGVQGCGKSLCAKIVAADWKMPLLRLDPGVLYQKFIGESESQLRRALAQAEAMAPVVLWIDEIEKAFASASAGSADGGLSKRMFGTLLSWMQDHRYPIFIIATANDISALPPELMRKGRFDEIFFVDLPDAPARAHILGIHLRRRKRDPANYNLDQLAEAAEGFSGAELEQAVLSALYAAFNERKELSDRHMLHEIEQTRPLSVMMAERITELRAWAADRCVPAD
jgi:AAA+ superfamily predicted ATPase